jgi:hypothetical protein
MDPEGNFRQRQQLRKEVREDKKCLGVEAVKGRRKK